MAKLMKDFLESYDFNRAAIAKQRLANLRAAGKKIKGARIANLMRAARMEETELDEEDLVSLDEVLGKDASASQWISDFVHSDAPQFEGKTKKERIKMALAAHYAKQRNEEKKPTKEDPPWHTDDKDKKSEFKKPNNPNRTGQDSARALAQKGMQQAMKEEYGIDLSDEDANSIVEGVLGALAGGTLGALTTGPLGAIAGAYLGHKVQQGANAKKKIADNQKKMRREEVEQIDEISSGLATSYLNKREAQHKPNMNSPETNNRDAKVAKGIRGAISRMHGYGPDKNAEDKVTGRFEYRKNVGASHTFNKEEVKKDGKAVDVDKVHAAGQEPHEEKFETFKKKPVKEHFDDEGNLIQMTKTYKEFIAEMEFVNGRYVHKGTYGNAGKGAKYGETDYDNEDLDKKDDDEAGEQKAKRGPKVGSKRGPRTNLGSSKLHQK